MKLKIERVKPAPFRGSDGTDVDYYWYKATRESDGVTIEFGSWKKYDVGSVVEVLIEKYERRDGKVGYKEVRPQLG